ncbi:hypothetical protein K431DRAFT_284362 [Polychaeton citri CBS 116435]|uniref:Multifunctional tryptophan biosynthesis protein n=1 Tax=Polychaeton citri CBS 116435 TaxID=1314669 RepID=A0A9P4Q9H3_9PEZI|nr:hypothetical protein K431DRAFT_284362 [Polychaeton citri CBS 116435]
MPGLDLIDHSPQQPQASTPIASASNLILIDNYDSFTWNVFQYLVLEGAVVTVYRNDEITLQALIELKPTQLVISPGPGHPETDSGVSKDAIKHFAGKIPILGVCMGEQCIFSVFGGTVSQTGEILHGKTSPLKHDGKGCYAGLPQNLPVTRYHSLAGTHPTIPDCLEVTSWSTRDLVETTDGTYGGERDVIMGVRHREFCIEGVQFHPESILTAEGRGMFKNFLLLRGGTWKENDQLLQQQNKQTDGGVSLNGTSPSTEIAKDKTTSILEKIYAHRKVLVNAQKEVPSQRPHDLQAAHDLGLAPPLVDFAARVKQSPFALSLLAEIKRASPSKGIINLAACAPSQARIYALAGASVISVLTEPEWFKGSIEDLRQVRRALDGMSNRPAVLRKEFVFDEYQILEARLNGADTVLLIVKMLTVEQLTRLYDYSRSLGMEPLVEVNTVEEMEVAVRLGAKVVGVNNRNLTSFEVDMDTTTRLQHMVGSEVTLCALSGISGPQDVEPYRKAGVGAVLVGEALMRADDTAAFISELLNGSQRQRTEKRQRKPLVKICGTRSAEAAKAAVEAGADLIGMILVTGRKRCVDRDTALQISKVVHSTSKPRLNHPLLLNANDKAQSWFKHTGEHHISNPNRALLVGVFLNQPLAYILETVRDLDLDIVQLHGQEPLEWANLIPVPVMHAFPPGDAQLATTGYHSAVLLDSGAGGSGQRLDTGSVIASLSAHEGLAIMLAGGLDDANVADAIGKLEASKSKLVGVDVSSGVEVDGKQDIDKIRAFIKNAKSVEIEE